MSGSIHDDVRVGDVDEASEPVRLVWSEDSGAAVIPSAVGRLNAEQTAMLGSLQSAVLGLQEWQTYLREEVALAREAGVSWNLIGWSMGMTGEGARKRWSSDVG